jgi:Pyruvate/2-oxoacid:ferredoxin oxidoreductase delta subunit
MDTTSGPRPTIHDQLCTGCGCCIDVCPSAVFQQEGDVVSATQAENCGGCGECELVCPEDAVEVSFSIVWGAAQCPDADDR